MRFRPARSQPDDEMRLELTSMTDIVFLLLIFFMVSTTFVDFSRQLDLQLPETQAAQTAQDAQPYVIELSADGQMRLDGQAVRLADLTQRLRQPAKGPRQRSAVIRADKRLPYGQVVKVLDQVRQADIQDIAVAVR